MKLHRHCQAGYTLLEMLTVIAIVVLMAGLAVASMAPLRERTAARQGAEQAQQQLLSARKKAIASARCYRVDLTDGAGTVVPAGTPGTAIRLRRYLRAGCDFQATPGTPQPTDADFETTDRLALPHGVTATVVSPPDVLDLLPTGRPKLTGSAKRLRLAISYLHETMFVDVSPAGAVCVQPPPGTESCP